MGRWTDRQKYSKTDADWSFPVPRAMDRLVSMDTGLNQHKAMLLLAHTHVCVLLKRIYVCSLSVFRRLIKSYVRCQPIKPWASSFYLFLNVHQKHMEASFTHSTATSQGHLLHLLFIHPGGLNTINNLNQSHHRFLKMLDKLNNFDDRVHVCWDLWSMLSETFLSDAEMILESVLLQSDYYCKKT